MVRIARSFAFVAVGLSLAVSSASAQDRRQNQPGQFDFYVLALSWSPSFCEAAGERGTPPQQQCGSRPYSFVVHGLWPQYEKGFPEFCQVPAPRLDRRIVSSMLDLMPSPRLIFNGWDKHGTCSGLSARAYFENVRKVRALVKIPDAYIDLKEPLTVTADEVEESFIGSNSGLTRDAISVTCDSRRLGEVRICLDKDFKFRSCPDVDARACRRENVVMPPVRDGSAALAR
jgi:ribonuclease T2